MWYRTEFGFNVLFIHLRTRKMPFNALVFTLCSNNSLSDEKSNPKISYLNKTFQTKSKHFRLLHALEMKYFWQRLVPHNFRQKIRQSIFRLSDDESKPYVNNAFPRKPFKIQLTPDNSNPR